MIPYYKGRIPRGNPHNPSGERWLGININDTYGIHGNNNVSQGCVRMYNADIEKLYDQVQVDTPIAITYSYKSFIDLTEVYGYQFKGYELKNN
ncbi:L,D-transpeptidase [Priestia megaterium]|uniref:L,D-transpeptidase n=1 Tax=Priestia megaterium TaxID=1404 RepID=UPI002E22ADC5|nr:L,D-transpeptidase [Priestia megaterium]